MNVRMSKYSFHEYIMLTEWRELSYYTKALTNERKDEWLKEL